MGDLADGAGHCPLGNQMVLGQPLQQLGDAVLLEQNGSAANLCGMRGEGRFDVQFIDQPLHLFFGSPLLLKVMDGFQDRPLARVFRSAIVHRNHGE